MDKEQQIELIKKLRQETLLPLGECRKILEESNWDINNLSELIKASARKISNKKQDRETNESKIFIKYDENQNKLYYSILGCETDFVASNEQFNILGNQIVEKVSKNELEFQDLIAEYIGKIGEKIILREFGTFECKKDEYYLHNSKKLVAINTNSSDLQLLKKFCFHVITIGSIAPIENIENLLKSDWYEGGNKDFNTVLKNENVILNNYLYIE